MYAVRHAESAMNVQPHLIGGRSNEAELTTLGVTQARALGQLLLQVIELPAVVYASPAVRTQATAFAAFTEMGIDPPIILDAALLEMDQGDYVGRQRADVYTPAVLEDIERLGKDFALPGGESMNGVGKRMVDWVHSHEEEADDGPLLFFGHGLAIRCLASTLHGWSHEKTFTTSVPNASLTKFVQIDGRWELAYLGRLPLGVQ